MLNGTRVTFAVLVLVLFTTVSSAYAEPPGSTAYFKGLNLSVESLERQRAFYEGIIGLKLARVISDGSNQPPQVLLTDNGKFDVKTSVLLALKELPESKLAPRADRAKFGNITFLVPDTEVVAKRAEAGGFKCIRTPIGIVLLNDPDGYSVELIQAQLPAGYNEN